MLEFLDDCENQDIQMNIIKIPQEQDRLPCLRVGQSLSAIIPKLQLMKNVDGEQPMTITTAHVDEGYPASPRIYLFGGTVYEKESDRSNYTGDLHMGEIPSFLKWQLQTDLSIDKNTGDVRGGPPMHFGDADRQQQSFVELPQK